MTIIFQNYLVTIFEALRALHSYSALAQFRNGKYLDLILKIILVSFLSDEQFFMGSNSWNLQKSGIENSACSVLKSYVRDTPDVLVYDKKKKRTHKTNSALL